MIAKDDGSKTARPGQASHCTLFVFAASLDMNLRKEDFWREMKGQTSFQWLEKSIPGNVL